ncbi:MAG: GNAT family N-acetyltransferase [Phycisphaerales bacterium]|nr:GNAT family N-acetyltransferase [Phycisphaerales bacterium]
MSQNVAPLLTIETPRLNLVAATLAHLEAELEAPARLSTVLQALVPTSWPPGEYDRPAIEFFRTCVAKKPEDVGWYGWYAIQRPSQGQDAVLVAAGGYRGQPLPDGTVEIGYSVLPEYRSRGYATEIVHALVQRAFAIVEITAVIAHTQANNLASIKVLEHCGFKLAGSGGDRGLVRYLCLRNASESGGAHNSG